MIVKVCGMREAGNIAAVAELGVSMIGFILYHKSKRYIGDDMRVEITPAGVERVGVFVNQSISFIADMVAKQSLTAVQLHGDESVEVCRAVKGLGVKVFKAISVATAEDFRQTTTYDGEVDMFIFDTKCEEYGGSGKRFDWALLGRYNGATPYLLSGGIDADCAESVNAITDSRMLGIDLNSRFEDAPAKKNITKLRDFINKLR